MRIMKNILKSLRDVKNISGHLDYVSKRNFLENELLNSENSIVDSNRRNKELIVSLTTYNKRIYDVALVIESIGRQTIKANRVILWLDEGEFKVQNLPVTLKNLSKRGLDIRFCPNLRSYKKLVPTLELFNNADIITVDDDIIYPLDMIEDLVTASIKYPNCVVAHHVHKMVYDKKGKLMPYNDWVKDFSEQIPSYENVAIGVGGVFYPAGSLSPICVEHKLFERLAPNADDIWFKAMSTLNKYKTVRSNTRTGFNSRFTDIPLSQDIALFNSNMKHGENNIQIENTFKYFKLFNFE